LLDIHVYWNILKMHGPINVKSPNNTSKWQMGFNSAFKGLKIRPAEGEFSHADRQT
jgi:formylmethanofuran dehydrogenase subunit B